MSELKDYERSRRQSELNAKVRLNMEMEGRNLFQDETLRRHRMSSGARTVLILAVILVILYLVSITLVPYGLVSFLQGNTILGRLWSGIHLEYSLASYRSMVVTRVGQLVDYITSGGSSTVQFIIFTHVVIMLAGMALAACGTAFQGVFQNPMASSTTLGVQSGGMLAGVLYIYFFGQGSLAYLLADSYGGEGNTTILRGSDLLKEVSQMNVFQLCGQQLITLAGCFFGVVLIVTIALAVGRGKLNTVALMLAGSVFSSVINQIAQLIQYVTVNGEDDIKATLISNLIGGRFSANDYTWYQTLMMAVPVLICLIILVALAGKINVIVFGADEAQAMGVNVTIFRNIIIAVCTILSSVVLSFCGQLALLDFMIPHFARYLVGPDFKVLIPASALLGAISTILVYDVCYMMAATSQFNMYTGVVCTVMSVFFILLFRRKRHADWA